MTYDEAIERIMLDNHGIASLQFLYQHIWNYKDKSKIVGKTPNNTIQERCQRNPKIMRIAYGVYALKDSIQDIENNNDKQIVIEQAVDTSIQLTQKQSLQNVRVGQQNFRNKLIDTLAECPITHIRDKKLLIASHIKPWVFCNNSERLNIYNGFLLSPLFDKLFDKSVGLITFTKDKEILFSKQMDRCTRDYLASINITDKQTIHNLQIHGRESFLEYHYQYIFARK
ncbi:hypothetical protein CCZ01_00845 [Helicobacter monodelphidis]|uniref:HNH endonuclease n=1 Tax=Helicobacter sp. 15-1451 TaxID=2004995 RepID=UPI000DCE4B02|nr:HNH endonuclease signature motif containing protein [Helicobacter sp. 15-1451]RAX59315.1 hypothetical protein CCZ01_00845 [Helicobacter sp. 15-1451]